MPRGSSPQSAPAGWHELRYSPVKLAAVVAAVAEEGVPAAQLLAGSGLTEADLFNPDTLTSSAQLYETLQRAVLASDQPGLGLRIGTRLRVTGYGMYGYALLCAPTMRAGLELAMRYHALANPLVPLRSREDGDTLAWLFPTAHELHLPGLGAQLHRVLIEMQMTIHLTLARDVMGAWCLPSRVLLSGPRPAHGDEIERTFGCPVSYDYARCEMHYPLSWMTRAPQLANAITAAQTSRECARLIAALQGETSIARRVYVELMRTPGQFPDADSVANRIGLTERTLRRQLQREGTRYSLLLASVRRALAEDYLGSTRMSVEDIASALDFDNARSFRQAFLRWSGKTPTEFRRRLR